MFPSQVEEKEVETVLEDSEVLQNFTSHFILDEEEEEEEERAREGRHGLIWALAETVPFYSLPAPA